MTTNETAPNSADFTYGSYLKIDELLSLQECVSTDPDSGVAEHDETLFIIIHQVYELWFKQILHELDHIVACLEVDRVGAARNHLKRVLKILKTLVGQIDVLETMTPAEFASFRDFLANASGFQSAQFRELEFLLGIKDRIDLDWFTGAEGERLRARYDSPTLWDAFVGFLARDASMCQARCWTAMFESRLPKVSSCSGRWSNATEMNASLAYVRPSPISTKGSRNGGTATS